MNLTLKIWRQAGPKDKGKMETYPETDISPEMTKMKIKDDINNKHLSKE